MSESARVTSIDALKDLREAIAAYNAFVEENGIFSPMFRKR